MNGFHSKLIKEKGLQNNIHLLGYRADIPQLLMASDLSVSASYREGLPVHIMEAMMAGLPVVSTRCRGVTELVVESSNGFLANTDERSFCEKLIACIGDPEMMKRFSKESLKLVQRYSVNKMKMRLYQIYRER